MAEVDAKAKAKTDKQDLSDALNSPAQQAYIMSLFRDNLLPNTTTSASGTIASTKVTQIADGATKPHVSLATILKKAAWKGLGN